MCLQESLVAQVLLGIGERPRESAENHTEENNCHTPYVGLAWVVGFGREDFRSKIRVRTDDARGERLRLSGVVENSCSSKVYELDAVVHCHDAVVKLEVAVRETHSVEVVDAITDLAEDAKDFGPAHFAGHDDVEQIIGSVLHNLGKSGQSDERLCGEALVEND